MPIHHPHYPDRARACPHLYYWCHLIFAKWSKAKWSKTHGFSHFASDFFLWSSERIHILCQQSQIQCYHDDLRVRECTLATTERSVKDLVGAHFAGRHAQDAQPDARPVRSALTTRSSSALRPSADNFIGTGHPSRALLANLGSLDQLLQRRVPHPYRRPIPGPRLPPKLPRQYGTHAISNKF